MYEKIDAKSHGTGEYGWLKPTYHFSFAGYYNPEKMGYYPLRVLNDDTIAAHKGFDVHPHEDMEIITYVIDGALTHGDSMGHERTLHRGEVQYMSAGTGVFHSEYNHGDETLRLLQIWIIPDAKGHKPNYGEKRFAYEERVDQWLHLVSNEAGAGAIKIHQDVNFYVTAYGSMEKQILKIDKDRQAYVVQIEGQSTIGEVTMSEKDALHIEGETFQITHKDESHILVIEFPKSLV